MPGQKPPTPEDIASRVRLFAGLMGLDGWCLQLSFETQHGERASCAARDEYREADINFNLSKIAFGDLDDLVVHELLHCLVWELAAVAGEMAKGDEFKLEMVRRAEERVVTHLEQMPIWPLTLKLQRQLAKKRPKR